MADRAQQTKNLDELLVEAGRVVEQFRCASPETQRDDSEVRSLVKLSKSLEKHRIKLLKTSPTGDLCLSISKTMFSLNEALRQVPCVEPSHQFAQLCLFLYLVETEPRLLQTESVREDFKKSMIDARQVGLHLCQDAAFQAGLEEVPSQNKKQRFFHRLVQVCCAHERYACVGANELPSILAEASKYEALSQTAKAIPYVNGLLAKTAVTVEHFKNASAGTQMELSEVNVLVRLFNSLEKIREKLQENPRARHQCLPVSTALRSISEALRKRRNLSPRERFVDLYHFLVVVDPQPEVVADVAARDELKQAIVEARQLGLYLLNEATFQADCDEKPFKRKTFFSRLAKVCRVHERYACVTADELPAILAEASKFEALAESVQQVTDTKAAEAQLALMEIEGSLASTPANLETCFQAASSLSKLLTSESEKPRPIIKLIIKHCVVTAFKLLKNERNYSRLFG